MGQRAEIMSFLGGYFLPIVYEEFEMTRLENIWGDGRRPNQRTGCEEEARRILHERNRYVVIINRVQCTSMNPAVVNQINPLAVLVQPNIIFRANVVSVAGGFFNNNGVHVALPYHPGDAVILQGEGSLNDIGLYVYLIEDIMGQE